MPYGRRLAPKKHHVTHVLVKIAHALMRTAPKAHMVRHRRHRLRMY